MDPQGPYNLNVHLVFLPYMQLSPSMTCHPLRITWKEALERHLNSMLQPFWAAAVGVLAFPAVWFPAEDSPDGLRRDQVSPQTPPLVCTSSDWCILELQVCGIVAFMCHVGPRAVFHGFASAPVRMME